MELKDDPKLEKSNSIFAKILIAFTELIGGSITTKIGFGILLIILGLVCLFSPIDGKPNKPIALIITGCVLLVIGILVIIRKITQTKKIKNEYLKSTN